MDALSVFIHFSVQRCRTQPKASGCASGNGAGGRVLALRLICFGACTAVLRDMNVFCMLIPGCSVGRGALDRLMVF